MEYRKPLLEILYLNNETVIRTSLAAEDLGKDEEIDF
jgi:hypothetical protein